jgi:hypothetical protein
VKPVRNEASRGADDACFCLVDQARLELASPDRNLGLPDVFLTPPAPS